MRVACVRTMLLCTPPGPRRRGARVVFAAALSVMLGACSMADSALLDSGSNSGCSSSAGNYYLSRSFLEVQVVVGPDGTKSFAGLFVKPKADRSKGYCLDYLASATANDTFVVQKDVVEPVLTKITSNADDQSKVIAQTIVQAVFVTLSGNPDFPGADAPNALKTRSFSEALNTNYTRAFGAEFDPFNEAQMALINDGLKDHGFCLVLEGQTFGRHARDINEYCNQPLEGHRPEAALVAASAYSGVGAFVPYTRGVLYRPRLPYNVFLFANARPRQKLPGQWMLRQTAAVYLENKSPTLAIGIDRALFAKRKTTLSFALGVLQDITVEKDSELVGAVEVPLQIVNSIAALPSQIVQVKINQTSRRTELIAAQDKLIKTQRDIEKDRLALQGTRTLPTAPSADKPLPTEAAQPAAPRSQCLAACEATGAPRDTCSIRCSGS
jgi:hypothetical protein